MPLGGRCSFAFTAQVRVERLMRGDFYPSCTLRNSETNFQLIYALKEENEEEYQEERDQCDQRLEKKVA